MNQVCLIGRLGGDPETRFAQDGKSIANFSLAVNESFTDAGDEKQEHVNWFRVAAFARTAEIVSEYLSKGMRVGVTGSLRHRTFEDKEGRTRSVVEIVARSIDFLSDGNGNGGHSDGAPPHDDEDTPF
jgi:single-strand DNA-binding protein